MKIIKTIFSFSLFLFLVQCQSPANQIKEAFNTVDKSLVKSKNTFSSSVEELYSAINLNRQNNEELALTADSIYFAVDKTNHFIDSIKQILQFEDKSGTDLVLATTLLVSTKTGDHLGKLLLDVNQKTRAHTIDIAKSKELDTVLKSIREIQNDQQWAQKYFEKTPTIAAITILSKFQMDCTSAARIILKDIYEHLEE